jgi:hypothetical protein
MPKASQRTNSAKTGEADLMTEKIKPKASEYGFLPE